MESRLRKLATTSLSTIAGMGVLAVLGITTSRVSAESFQPIKEADMPRGFPEYTPIGQVEVKQYPAYRKASATGVAEFWTLFSHIKKNNVQMTAPVEMDYGDPKAKKPSDRSMSFLYPSVDHGSTGKHGTVEVLDVPAMSVVSIGCRGHQTPEAIATARQKLLDYLGDREDQYAIDGSMRVMGYNSPFVPRDKNFFEVQIPVKAIEAN